MSQTQAVTQEMIYRIAQPRAPASIDPPLPRIPAINPLALAGGASAQANVDLNRMIREEAKALA